MQFLKTLLIVFTVGLAVAFAFNNWTSVEIRLWGGLLVDINKPLLLLLCFLTGLVPTWAWQKAANWRLRQRLATSERTIADLRAAVAAPVPMVITDTIESPIAPPPVETPLGDPLPIHPLPIHPLPIDPPQAPPLTDPRP